ncbi:hypothetical protein BRADI_2g25333v3 [Brachypodium distachyon]|uniref:F-box domain-containing protein n=1 Tax=Brachypodium distachyon TaxID=15368 RepID=A0A0Q3J0R2_BRADI|nr:hypothetical protein BRADI_2g25333v3 [Brachypodium distachyon]
MKICKSVTDNDIIGNLQEALKDKILCCLPIKEAVRTCLLSRNWRYTWASMTELMFSTDEFTSENGNADDGAFRFLMFTNMFLSLHNGPVLKKFGLKTRGTQIIYTGGHIYRRMVMLSRDRIKEIQLNLRQFLHLQACHFTSSQLPPLSKGFKHLHTLHLICLNLEELAIFKFISIADINIHSTKLKKLTIDGNFEHLNLHAPYLASATIRLIFHTGDASNARCDFNLSQFIDSRLDAENIILHGQIFEIDLGNVMEADLALCLFQHAPNLRFIVLKLISRNTIVSTANFWESINRQNFTGSSAELGFLKLLLGLGDAPVLRTVEIRGKKKLQEDAFKNLLKMRRASKDAKIVVI